MTNHTSTCTYCTGNHASTDCHLRPRPAAFPAGGAEAPQPYSPWV